MLVKDLEKELLGVSVTDGVKEPLKVILGELLRLSDRVGLSDSVTEMLWESETVAENVPEMGTETERLRLTETV